MTLPKVDPPVANVKKPEPAKADAPAKKQETQQIMPKVAQPVAEVKKLEPVKSDLSAKKPEAKAQQILPMVDPPVAVVKKSEPAKVDPPAKKPEVKAQQPAPKVEKATTIVAPKQEKPTPKIEKSATKPEKPKSQGIDTLPQKPCEMSSTVDESMNQSNHMFLLPEIAPESTKGNEADEEAVLPLAPSPRKDSLLKSPPRVKGSVPECKSPRKDSPVPMKNRDIQIATIYVKGWSKFYETMKRSGKKNKKQKK